MSATPRPRQSGTAALLVLLLGALVVTLASPGNALAGIVRDHDDTPGPLDLTQVKLGQHAKQLDLRFETATALPHLKKLSFRPSKEGAPGRYLCLRLESDATGRRLLCPGGKLRNDQIEVGVSSVSRKGVIESRGSIEVPAKRDSRELSLVLSVRGLGLMPGGFSFGADTAWTGAECRDGSGNGGGLRGRATCFDHAPQNGNGKERIYPLRRAGCTGLSQTKVFNGSRDHNDVALTFDDGPGAYTPEVLKVLAEHHVNATFFEIGEQVPTYASTVRQILAQGNEIGNHSLHHETDPLEPSLSETQSLIKHASGYAPCMFRPPGGDEPSSTLAAAEALALVSVIWDVDTEDYTLPGSEAIYQRAVAVQPGSIVLMHDGGGDRSETVAALPRIIENLKSRGFHLVTMTHLLGGEYVYDEVHGHHSRPLPDLEPFPRYRPGP